MRISPVRFAQHIGWHFNKHWRVQGKRKIVNTGAEKILKRRGVAVHDAVEFLKEKPVYERVEVVGFKDKPIPLDKTHPNWHDEILLTYGDDNVLLEGLPQAKILTNTVEEKEGLPESLRIPELTREFNRKVEQIILSSHVFDAEQKKLPKLRDPERPAFNFPRVYGITHDRVFKLLISRLLNLIEITSNRDLVRERSLVDDVHFSFPFKKYGQLIQFQLSGDSVVLSSKPLKPVTQDLTEEIDLPDISPIVPTITLNENNIYTVQNLYPIKTGAAKRHPHTIISNFNKEVVKNLYEKEVTENQIFGRSLLKAFTAAAAYGRQNYGDDVKSLENPVTMQSIQTDGRIFYFGILQLNTLDLEDNKTRNIWYQTPGLPLFEKCCYKAGKPVLEGYNPEVVRNLVAFYNNV